VSRSNENAVRTADVAVIVPVRDRAKVVLATLDRVAAQSLQPTRLVVVDDGSSDGTAHSVRQWCERTAASFETRIIRQPGRGPSAARNRGLRARGACPFVAFLDSDDLWPGDFLERTSAVLVRNERAVAATCDRRYVDALDGTERHDDLSALAQNATHWIFTNDGGIGSCTLFRAEPVESLGGYREQTRTGEDSELFLRVSLLGPWLHVAGDPVTFRMGLARARGEQGNLSRQHADSHRTWAAVHEDFIVRHGGGQVVARHVVRFHLAWRWYRAGRQLMAAGRVDEARSCYRRSCRWRRWNKAWLRLALSYVAGPARLPESDDSPAVIERPAAAARKCA